MKYIFEINTWLELGGLDNCKMRHCTDNVVRNIHPEWLNSYFCFKKKAWKRWLLKGNHNINKSSPKNRQNVSKKCLKINVSNQMSQPENLRNHFQMHQSSSAIGVEELKTRKIYKSVTSELDSSDFRTSFVFENSEKVAKIFENFPSNSTPHEFLLNTKFAIIFYVKYFQN